MLRLIAMRHAKSDWDSGAETDHARPLNKRGKRDSPRVGARIAELGWTPTLVLSSDSARTRETWELTSVAFDGDVEVRWLSEFYHGSPRDIIAALEVLPPQEEPVMVLGHNPGWSYFVSQLLDASIEMTTANAALLESPDDDWATALAAGSFELVELIRPRELPEA